MSGKPLGDLVASLRKERGLTQEQLAEHAKVGRRTIQRLEKSQRIRPASVRAVSDALGVPAARLFGPGGVTALVELAEEMSCPCCGARATHLGSFDHENVDVDYEVFACGAADGLQFRPCPKDPRFPTFADYELSFHLDGDIIYCHARGMTEMARAVPLDTGFGSTEASAAKWVEKSFIALRDGYEAAENFYPLYSHR